MLHNFYQTFSEHQETKGFLMFSGVKALALNGLS